MKSKLVYPLVCLAIFFPMISHAASLGGKGLIYNFALTQSLELVPSLEVGSNFRAAFYDGKNIPENEQVFTHTSEINFCFFGVQLSNADFFEYLKTKAIPKLVLGALNVDLQQSQISASFVMGTQPEKLYKTQMVSFLFHTVGSSIDLVNGAVLPLQRADHKYTESFVTDFTCMGPDVVEESLNSVPGAKLLGTRPSKL